MGDDFSETLIADAIDIDQIDRILEPKSVNGKDDRLP